MSAVKFLHLVTMGAVFSFGLSVTASEIPPQPKSPGYPIIPFGTSEREREQKEAAAGKASKLYYQQAMAWILTVISEAKEADEIEIISVSTEPITEPLKDGGARLLYTTDRKHVGGYPIISRALVHSREERTSLLRELRGLVENQPEEMAECFAPRHAVRLKIHGSDYYALICFQCSGAHFFSATNGEQLAIEIPIGKKSEVFFDQLLTAHGMKKAP